MDRALKFVYGSCLPYSFQTNNPPVIKYGTQWAGWLSVWVNYFKWFTYTLCIAVLCSSRGLMSRSLHQHTVTRIV